MPSWLSADIRADLLAGLVVTIALTVATTIAASMVAVTVAKMWRSPRSLPRRAARAFVDVFRNVPALIQVIFFAFAVPNLFEPATRASLFFNNAVMDSIGDVSGLSIPYYALAGALALSLNTGAHLAEILRSGLQDVPRERVDSARSLGASARQAFSGVELPHAVRSTFPALTNRWLHNMKNTSLVSFVAVPDLFQVVQGSINQTFRATEFLVLAAGLYLALSLVMTGGFALVERSLRRGRPAVRGARG